MPNAERGLPAPLSAVRRFKKIYVEITNRCNLSCPFCSQSQSLRSKAWMAVEAFAQVVREVIPHTGHLALHVLGEPLLHPQLDSILALCQSQSLKVNLTTNATLLAERQELLLRSPALRQINISLHSTLDGFVAPASYLADTFSFISEVARARTDLFVCLRLWDITGRVDPGHADRRRQLLRQLEVFFALPQQLAGGLTPGQGIRLAPKVFLSQNRRFDWPHRLSTERGEIGTCRGLRDHLAILVDGTVVPCCLDAEADIPLGNILTQPLADILEGPRAKAMYQGLLHQRLLEPLCRRCTFRRSR